MATMFAGSHETDTRFVTMLHLAAESTRSWSSGLLAQRTTALAPMIKSRRRSRCPMFEVRPRRAIPPEKCCLGVSPIQAARSRPGPKVSGGGAATTNARAVTGPTPRTVIGCQAVSSARLCS
jgi:hypothetical protein